jgi:hypothetical protein
MGCAKLCLLAILGAAILGALPGTSLAAAPASFGPGAELITFDDLGQGNPLSFQLVLRGVTIRSGDGAWPRVVSADDLGGAKPRSQPHAVQAVAPGEPLRIEFATPKQQVGVHVGPFERDLLVTLVAYDGRGEPVDQIGFKLRPLPHVTGLVSLDAGQPIVHSVLVHYSDPTATVCVDDLVVEPSHEATAGSPDAYQDVLSAPYAKEAEKLDAIAQLQQIASARAAEVLRDALSDDSDPYVRERVALALAQIADRDALPALVEVGLVAEDRDLKRAALNAIWSLHQLFPPADPPQVHFEVFGSLAPEAEFDVQATLVSPVPRSQVRAVFRGGKRLERRPSELPDAFDGARPAGEPVALRARFVAPKEGIAEVVFTVTVAENRADAVTYRFPLYLDVESGGGSAGTELPPRLDEPTEHALSEDGVPGE